MSIFSREVTEGDHGIHSPEGPIRECGSVQAQKETIFRFLKTPVTFLCMCLPQDIIRQLLEATAQQNRANRSKASNFFSPAPRILIHGFLYCTLSVYSLV